MSQNIILETSTGKLICPDCGCDMHEERYDWGYSTHTCQTKGCELQHVTLGKDQWQTAPLEEYRKMNRQNVLNNVK